MSAAVDLAAITKLTNLNDIHKLLHETLAKEISVDADLNKLLGKRVDLEHGVLQLNVATREVRAGGVGW